MIAIGGENLIDLVGASDGGGAPVYVPHPGGSPFNVAMAAGRQGAKTAYLTPVSSDALGGMLAKRLEDSGVVLAGGRSGKPTSLAVVSISDGIPTYAFYRTDTAERQVDGRSIAGSMPDGVGIFHVGSNALIAGDDAEAWEDAFHKAASDGILTSMDPNIRPSLVEDADAHRARIKRMMRSAGIFKASDEDVEWLYPGLGMEDILKACVDDAPDATVVVTAGERSAQAFSGDQSFSVPTHEVEKIADTVGAGDTFMASLLVWCSQNGGTRDEMVEAMRSPAFETALGRGAVAAALNCEHEGCEPPSSDAIDAALENYRGKRG